MERLHYHKGVTPDFQIHPHYIQRIYIFQEEIDSLKIRPPRKASRPQSESSQNSLPLSQTDLDRRVGEREKEEEKEMMEEESERESDSEGEGTV